MGFVKERILSVGDVNYVLCCFIVVLRNGTLASAMGMKMKHLFRVSVG